MDGKHTPGPWTYGGPVKRESVIKEIHPGCGPNGFTKEVWEVGPSNDVCPPAICVVNDYCTEDGIRTNAEANARLIAAAPDLLAACNRVYSYLFRKSAIDQNNREWDGPMAFLCKVISQATGK